MPEFLRKKMIILKLKNETFPLRLDICVFCGIQKNIQNDLLLVLCQVLL